MSLWCRATDEWRRKNGELVAKAGTKWHLIDTAASDAAHVYAACDSGLGRLRERSNEVLSEEPTVIKRGEVVPTPGRGAVCARCYKRAVAAS